MSIHWIAKIIIVYGLQLIFFSCYPQGIIHSKNFCWQKDKRFKNHCFAKLCLKLSFGNPKTLIVTKKEGMKDRSLERPSISLIIDLVQI